MKTPREVLLSQHQDIEPKLDQMWSRIAARPDSRSEAETPLSFAAIVPYQLLATLWRELIWPCRRIWAGLACVWLLIIGLNLASSDSSQRVASKPEPRSREEMQALIEQRRMLAQMIEPMAEPASQRKSNPSGPRSDCGGRISAA